MNSAAQLFHAYLGSPPGTECDSCEQVPCWMCGGETLRGVFVKAFAGASFTGQSRVRAPSSPIVCEACVYVCGRTNPVPGRPPKEGKEFGGNYRNYSHLYDDASSLRYANASKGEKPAILSFLRATHTGTWFAAIADSGQKHVLPWAPVNPPGSRGRVLFDETTIALPDEGGWMMVDDLAALLTAGATKEEIALGHYGSRAWTLCPSLVRAFESKWGARRGDGWFGLALWLAQRDEATVADRMATEATERAEKKEAKRGTTKRRATRETKVSDRGDVARDPSGVPGARGKCDHPLGPIAEHDVVSIEKVRDAGRGSDGDVPQSSAAGAVQLGLPGLG